ncbi:MULTISPECIES: M23 family metallopeptidase [unclassified Microbacterium]|uniref:M23 family metallopeptidase n=1 Tax=unclassified Microbacterium TaxID=2609290 RepID=UPI00217E3D86|nr:MULTISPECIES: M23 family metallopeptidase [unclassified Microbacterium]
MPTRRSSRLRTAASEAPAAGTTEPTLTAESIVALAAVAPLSRRAARQRLTVDAPIADAPLARVDDAPADIVAEASDAPLATEKVEELVEITEEISESTAAPESVVFTGPIEMPAGPAAQAADAEAADHSTADARNDSDAFDRASRAFRAMGSASTAPAFTASSASSAPEEADETAATAETDESGTASHVAPRRHRGTRKFLAFGATVGVMSLAGLLAVSMTLPAEAVAAAQGPGAVAAISLTTASAAAAHGAGEDEIQAFVAPSGVENESLARSDDFSTISLVEVAAEQGINYSNEIFTNDPEAAIQWPFLVGVGMSYGYGMRSGRLHEGIDFVPGNGAPIQAIADGTVRTATEQGGAFGVTVYIDHIIDGQKITSHYSHMQYGSLQVKDGDTVKVGDIVGKTGNTGRSYGAHLHFELIVNGSTIDPMPWLNKNAGRYSY